MEAGARHLADTCFTQARSQEPADSATWAAMGALAGLSATGELAGLDPTSMHLPIDENSKKWSDMCFTEARSQELADSVAWAATGVSAGLCSRSACLLSC